jgi:glycosyltransferase involved in cell wall biosynthesis
MESAEVNIFYAVHAYKPAFRVGGPVISVSAAAETLVRKGHRVTVFTSTMNLDQELDVPTNRPVGINGVEVWYFRRVEPLKNWFPFIPYLSRSIGYLYCPDMRAALDRIIPSMDIVDTQMPYVYPSYAAAHAAFRHDKPLFYHQRGAFNPSRLQFRGIKKRLYITGIEKPIMKRATTLIALAEGERRAFEALGIATQCEIVPNGIDVQPPRDEARKRVEQRYGIRRDAPVVLFLGRLHPTKGADILLNAFARVAAVHASACLVMAGPDEWGLEPEWIKRIAETGLSERVIFTGMLEGEEKADMLERADLFCLPSTGEGFSIAVLEALAAATAVVLSPGCNFDEVEAAGAGRVVARDENAVADALKDLLSDGVRLAEMGRAGRRLVTARYSWNEVADRLLSVYGEGFERHAKTAGRALTAVSVS